MKYKVQLQVCSIPRCEELAQLVRCTQFAGDHPFCEKHGMQEKNFGENNDYHYWVTMDQYRKSHGK